MPGEHRGWRLKLVRGNLTGALTGMGIIFYLGDFCRALRKMSQTPSPPLSGKVAPFFSG